MRGILQAFGFLTIIPLAGRQSDKTSEKELGGSSAFFPVIGIALGLAAAGACFGLEKVFPPAVSAALLVAGLTLVSGGLHVDGLSDTLDALASRKSRERMLEIMRDSAAGPIGTAGVVLILVLKILLLESLLEGGEGRYFLLVLMPMAGKWSMTAALYHGSSARTEGLGKVFIDHTGISQFALATALTAAFAVALAGWRGMLSTKGLVMLAAVHLVVYCAARGLVRLFRRRFRGLTGDNLGAVHEIGEVLTLLTALPLLAE